MDRPSPDHAHAIIFDAPAGGLLPVMDEITVTSTFRELDPIGFLNFLAFSHFIFNLDAITNGLPGINGRITSNRLNNLSNAGNEVAAVAIGRAGPTGIGIEPAFNPLEAVIGLAVARLMAANAASSVVASEAGAVDDLISVSVQVSSSRRLLQLERSGGLDAATGAFDDLARQAGQTARTVQGTGGPVRIVDLPGGGTASLRGFSSGGRPTIQINRPGEIPVKIRY